MNFSFPRVLVPVDGSPQSIVAFKAAISFAQKFGSHLVTVHIDEKGVNEQGLRNMLDQHANGYNYHYMHKAGSVHKEIIHAAKETDSELIVMGTHGVSGFQEFWMGSNANKVVTQATCPVLTMREDVANVQFKNIVLPIDTSFESRQKVPSALQIALKFGATVHVLGVSGDKDKEAEHKINTYTRQVIHSLEEKGVKTISHRLLGGNITKNTIDYAEKAKADLVMIMTEQELQMGSFFLGKFAQQMVNHSSIPVMSIPPREDLMTTEARL